MLQLLNKLPDSVQIASHSEWESLQIHSGIFTNDKVKIELIEENGLNVYINAIDYPLSFIKLRWNFDIPTGVKIMGDALERSYGDLEWRGMNADRYLFWYTLIYFENRTFGYGVKVQPSSIAYWQIDGAGVTLWLNVKCGGMPLELGDKVLKAATVVSANSNVNENENPFSFGQRFCKIMSPDPLKVSCPVYGSNNWYYAYGISSQEQILKDTKFLTDLTNKNENKPFMIIDAGWQEAANNYNTCAGGPWSAGNSAFPDIKRLAGDIKTLGARPGIWARFIMSHDETLPDSMMIKRDGGGRLLDPTVPDSLQYIRDDVKRICGWGYELIKHDFSSFDLFGRFGLQMDFNITDNGWCFYDKSKTTAEVIKDFYRAIYESAGNTLILGCNCVGHLGAGLMHLQRIGDDTSGLRWDRTRKMGVNTLAYRFIQHKAFFEIDADCCGHTGKIPWDMNSRWLDILAKSGTSLFVSVDPDIVTPEQKKDIKMALFRASIQADVCEPVDWFDSTTPSKWLINGEENIYDWYAKEGVYDFGSLG